MNKNNVILKFSITETLVVFLVAFIASFNKTESYEALPKLNSNCAPGFKKNLNNECIP